MGSRPPNSIIVGNNPATGMPAPAREIWLGAEKVWPALTWEFEDDFERPNGPPGPKWSGSGGWINNGTLRKDGNPGEGRLWTVQQFSSDDLVVRAKLGPIDNGTIRAGIKLGNPTYGSNWVGVDFSDTVLDIVGYDGDWPILASAPAEPWGAGDELELRREGETLTVYRNGDEVLQGQSPLAIGSSYRHVNLTVNMEEQGFLNIENHGPSFESVRVGTL